MTRYLGRGAGLHSGELLVSLGVPELVQRDIEHHQQLETASEEREGHYFDQMQLS